MDALNRNLRELDPSPGLSAPFEAPEPLRLLVIDNERAIREACRELASRIGMIAFTAENAAAAQRVLEAEKIDVVLLDLRLPGSDGMELLRQIRQQDPDLLVVVITGFASIQTAVAAMKAGAYDYVTKPFNLGDLRSLLERAATQVREIKGVRSLQRASRAEDKGFGNLIGRSPEMQRLYRMISKVANSAHPVLILGESGTGKELVAREIHYSSPNREKPFVPVDCGSLVPTLIESELFGYVKGAFTGAGKTKEGLLQAAEGGTVFLDEIGELPIDLQAKLLRALQEKEIRPVGSTKRVPINVRVGSPGTELEFAL